MKLLKLVLLAAMFSATSAFVVVTTVIWKAQKEYSVKTDMGYFKGLDALISFDEINPEKSRIVASIDATSFETGNGLMNTHAKDKEGLYTERYRLITFVSTSIKRIEGSRYEATGNLSLKGIMKEIKLPFTFDSKNNVMDRFPMVPKGTFAGKIVINSKDFNITRDGAPPTVVIDLMIPVKQ
ncbi:hypothetical protein CNR22_13770 [Sphingobacteriaceae bacterium]|nr:hypothetical protein CNR22_13770 [Sphingobacteriaceae bacterium]